MPNHGGRWGELYGDEAGRALAQALRDTAERFGMSLRRLESAMPYSRTMISGWLNGRRRPDWAFVQHFIAACTGPDQHAVELLHARIRPLWEAADPARPDLLGRPRDEPGDEVPPELIDRLKDLVRQYEGSNTAPEPQASAAEERPAPHFDGGLPQVWGGPVPQRNPHFTGRTELLQSLRSRFGSSSTQVLHGMFGVGKTQVAVEYAHRHRKDYWLVWWVPAESPARVRSVLAGLAKYLKRKPDSGMEIEDICRDVLSALSNEPAEGRWLLIFDNADRPEQIRHLIPLGHGDVLITSRDLMWRTVTPDATLVNAFTREESVHFLRKRLGQDTAAAEAELLASGLDDLPLALGQAAALCGQFTIGAMDYLALLRDTPNRILSKGVQADYPIPMARVWTLSTVLLEERCPDALGLLRHCAVLGSVTLADLEPGATHANGQVADFLSDPIRLGLAIEELTRSGFAHVDPTDQTLRLHPLVRALALDELPPEDPHSTDFPHAQG
jgi:transcriptional regulator with XRE-family HTH domain